MVDDDVFMQNQIIGAITLKSMEPNIHSQRE